VSSDATQFRLIEKIFSIHGWNAFRAIQRAGCHICSTGLVSALNLNIINFGTGSAQIPADQYDSLN
jgi:hypothetical protein